MSEGPTNVNNASTGAAIFGASPVPSQPVIPAAFGHAPDRTIITPPPLTKIQGAQISEDHFSKPVSNNSDWAALWPKEHHSNGVNTIPIENAESSEKKFGLPLATTSRTITSAFSTASNNLPINPFTGSSNLTQLNTSPWPTTGSSPVQSSQLNWPPSLDNGSKIGNDTFSTQPIQSEIPHSRTTSSHNSNFADFGSVNPSSNANLSRNKSGLGPIPDPFGSAPSSNLHTQSDNSNDLFANAPMPTLNQENDIDKTIDILTSDIFGKSNSSQNHSKNVKEVGQYDFGIDPWASSNAPNDSDKTIPSNFGWPISSDNDTVKQTNVTNNLFASSILPASKSTNPFL